MAYARGVDGFRGYTAAARTPPTRPHAMGWASVMHGPPLSRKLLCRRLTSAVGLTVLRFVGPDPCAEARCGHAWADAINDTGAVLIGNGPGEG